MSSPRGSHLHAVPEQARHGYLVLNPAVRVLWRAADCVQLELGDRALVLDGVDPHEITALTGRGAAAQAPTGMHPDDVRRLTAAGFASVLVPGTHTSGAAPTLAGELAALTARRGVTGAGAFAARAHRLVSIIGPGRVAAHLAAVLAASGVGRVAIADGGTVRLAQVLPGGAVASDEGRRHCDAAADAIARAAPTADTAPVLGGDEPDLVVLAIDQPLDDERRDELHRRGRTHLSVRVGAGHAVIGPLVVPGHTSCLRCADLHRGDRDPAWPALAVQLTVAPRYGPVSETALATFATGLTALQALQFLDGSAPASVDGTLEVHLPDWRIRRRSWPRHPECDCADEG